VKGLFLSVFQKSADETSDREPLWRRLLPALLVVLAASLFTTLGHYLGFNRSVENAALDFYVQANPLSADDIRKDMLIVGIQDADYKALFGSHSPLDPRKLSELIKAILSGEPKVIVVDICTKDIDFELPASSTKIVWTRAGKRLSAEGLAALKAVNPTGARTVFAPDPVLGKEAPAPDTFWGIANTRLDADGILRRYYRHVYIKQSSPLVVRPAPTAIWAATQALRRGVCDDGSADMQEKILFSTGGPENLSRITAANVFSIHAGSGWKDMVRGKIVLLGGYYDEKDRYQTAVGERDGVEIIAEAIESELRRGGVSPLSEGLLFVAEVLAGLTVVILSCFCRRRWLPLVSIAVIPLFAFLYSAVSLSSLYLWVNIVPVVLAVPLYYYLEQRRAGQVAEPVPGQLPEHASKAVTQAPGYKDAFRQFSRDSEGANQIEAALQAPVRGEQDRQNTAAPQAPEEFRQAEAIARQAEEIRNAPMQAEPVAAVDESEGGVGDETFSDFSTTVLTARMRVVCLVCGREFDDMKARVCPYDDTELSRIRDDDLVSGNLFAGRYEIEGLLGQGGMSTVYKARHKFLEKSVALKVLRPNREADKESVMRFYQEARATAMLSHPNVIGATDFGITPEGKPFLVLDFVEGQSLRDYVRDRGSLEETHASELFLQICDGLDFAHKHNVLHRDLKPSNIMLVARDDSEIPQVKIVDFGLAKIVSSDLSITSTGVVVGSPLYMSPEQCQGWKVDQRSDIYSLGCIMYECLAGYPPFKAENMMDLFRAHIDKAPVPLDATGLVSREMSEIVLAALAKKPEDRFASAADLKARLLFYRMEEMERRPLPYNY
jgi:CHASE2 domain-containing sensor protein/tRNA A-37 threonylcarbamoyl transferase component Bud32